MQKVAPSANGIVPLVSLYVKKTTKPPTYWGVLKKAVEASLFVPSVSNRVLLLMAAVSILALVLMVHPVPLLLKVITGGGVELDRPVTVAVELVAGGET